jgi:ArsR family transcriptional regulator, arsenate/arsenite/antimonite-responsive transcriptional repressor
MISLTKRMRIGMPKVKNEPDLARYADMFSAMGTEPRLRIMRLLLSAHPDGMIAGDIGALSHIWTN